MNDKIPFLFIQDSIPFDANSSWVRTKVCFENKKLKNQTVSCCLFSTD
jgi:hypothetical protein